MAASLARKADHQRRSPIAVHMGQILMMVAATYPRLLDFILEIIQNSIDAGAKQIDIRINMQKRSLKVTDDGLGVSPEVFEQALTQIGMTMKDKKNKLGRFGRGLISPLGKCRCFRFTSCPMRKTTQTTGYRQWTFVTDDIASLKVIEGIPYQDLPQLMFSRVQPRPRRDVTFVNWRTSVEVEGITSDRALSDIKIDDLIEAILSKYGVAMRRLNTSITIGLTDIKGQKLIRQVTAKDFEGEALQEYSVSAPRCGSVVFRLFIARKTANGRKGRILFGERDNDFRINTKLFWDQLAGLLDEEIIKVLRSGIFEGEILASKISLHPDRKRFEENDALLDFCQCIGLWYQKVGQAYADEVLAEYREKRYQKAGLRAIKVIAAMLREPQWADVLALIKIGTIGDGHFDRQIIGEQPDTSLSNQGKPDGVRVVYRSDPPIRSEPRREYDDHHPMTVAGPQGQTRRTVRDGSTGLQFIHAVLSLVPFEFDSRRGILTFNVSHPYWVRCEDSSETALTRYHEVVAITALTLVRHQGQDFYDNIRVALEEQLGMLVFDIIHGDVLAGRRAGQYRGKR